MLAINHFCATNFHTQSGSNLGIFSDSRWRWDVFLSSCSHVLVRMVSEAKTLMSARGHARLLAAPTLSVSALPGLSGTKPLPSDASREHISINNTAFFPLYLHAGSQTSKHSSVCIYIGASDHQGGVELLCLASSLLSLCSKQTKCRHIHQKLKRQTKTTTNRAGQFNFFVMLLARGSIKRNMSSSCLGFRQDGG